MLSFIEGAIAYLVVMFCVLVVLGSNDHCQIEGTDGVVEHPTPEQVQQLLGPHYTV
jgi:hypothetical protein